MLLANGPFCAAEGELFLELFDVAAMTIMPFSGHESS